MTIPRSALNIIRHMIPDTTGVIIIGMIYSDRRSFTPLNSRERSSAISIPRTICPVTVETTCITVTLMAERKYSSLKARTKFPIPANPADCGFVILYSNSDIPREKISGTAVSAISTTKDGIVSIYKDLRSLFFII